MIPFRTELYGESSVAYEGYFSWIPFLETLRNHPDSMIRDEVRGILDWTMKPSNCENNGAVP